MGHTVSTEASHFSGPSVLRHPGKWATNDSNCPNDVTVVQADCEETTLGWPMMPVMILNEAIGLFESQGLQFERHVIASAISRLASPLFT